MTDMVTFLSFCLHFSCIKRKSIGKKVKKVEEPQKKKKSLKTDFEKNMCTGFIENFNETTKKYDWLQGVICQKWSYYPCSVYKKLCNQCGINIAEKINNVPYHLVGCTISPAMVGDLVFFNVFLFFKFKVY